MNRGTQHAIHRSQRVGHYLEWQYARTDVWLLWNPKNEHNLYGREEQIGYGTKILNTQEELNWSKRGSQRKQDCDEEMGLTCIIWIELFIGILYMELFRYLLANGWTEALKIEIL